MVIKGEEDMVIVNKESPREHGREEEALVHKDIEMLLDNILHIDLVFKNLVCFFKNIKLTQMLTCSCNLYPLEHVRGKGEILG